MKRVLPLLLAALATAHAEDFQGADHPLEYDHEPINYSSSQPHDPVSVVQQKILSGALKLNWDEKFGCLPALLEAFGAKKSSQVLVMSKTSLQRRYITPENPRSVFFSDDVYLGYIPGAPVMEISSVDPQLGGTFYFIEQEKVRKPNSSAAPTASRATAGSARSACPATSCAACPPMRAARCSRWRKCATSRNARR